MFGTHMHYLPLHVNPTTVRKKLAMLSKHFLGQWQNIYH